MPDEGLRKETETSRFEITTCCQYSGVSDLLSNNNNNNNEKKGSTAFGETEKIASTPRPGIEPGPPANAADALPLSYRDWLSSGQSD